MVQQVTRPPLVRGKWYPMGWEEFLDWGLDKGKTEWVAGKGIADVPTTTRHGRMLSFFGHLVGLYVRAFSLGEVFIDNVLMRLPTRPSGRAPDIMVILPQHQHRILKLWHEGPADFVVEFVSDDDPERDTVVKLKEYADAGVPEYLWVDAREGRHDFRFHRHTGDGYQLIEPDADGRYHSEVLSGFWFDPTWFWQDPLPDINRLMLTIAPQAYREYLMRLLAESENE